MRPSPTQLLALVLTAAPASAQKVNVDVGGTATGAPSSAYGAAAGQPGVWNVLAPLTTGSPMPLVGLDGAPTGLTLSFPSIFNAGVAFDDPATLGDDGALVDDGVRTTGTLFLTVSGLAHGSYTVTTYARSVDDASDVSRVIVPGSFDGPQLVGGAWPGGHAHGVSYARHAVEVGDLTGGTLQIRIDSVVGQGTIGGFQIVDSFLAVYAPFCEGDGTSPVACPCGNTGSAGRGCENSAGTGGALLTASGWTSPDTLVLRSAAMPPSATTIFLQGDGAIVGGVVFGDGVRCVGGGLVRLYVETAVGGHASAPGPGDPQITTRSALAGDPIAIASTRWYQAYYRDPDAAFCPPPAGDTWNVTNGIAVVW